MADCICPIRFPDLQLERFDQYKMEKQQDAVIHSPNLFKNLNVFVYIDDIYTASRVKRGMREVGAIIKSDISDDVDVVISKTNIRVQSHGTRFNPGFGKRNFRNGNTRIVLLSQIPWVFVENIHPLENVVKKQIVVASSVGIFRPMFIKAPERRVNFPKEKVRTTRTFFSKSNKEFSESPRQTQAKHKQKMAWCEICKLKFTDEEAHRKSVIHLRKVKRCYANLDQLALQILKEMPPITSFQIVDDCVP